MAGGLLGCETYTNAVSLAQERGLSTLTLQEFKRLYCSKCRPLSGNCPNEDKARGSFQRIVQFNDRLPQAAEIMSAGR